ncbi:MAG: hypothetical protein R3E39_09095 [Anaerolineae bacterium]
MLKKVPVSSMDYSMTSSPRISRREWRNVLLYALLIILLTSLPSVLGYVQQGSQWAFSGFLFGADDGYSYIAKMRLGARGILDFYLFYTPEPHNSAALIFLPYILPGWLVGRFVGDHDPSLVPALTLMFHAMRVVFDALLIVVLYRFIAIFLRAPRTRFVALLLATVGGGLGWLLLVAGAEPPEFLIPEGFSFLILLGLPHLALARAALLGGLILVISQDHGRRQVLDTRKSVLAALCWWVVGLAVPFYLAIVYVILGMWGLMAWIMTRRFPLRLAVNGGLAAALTLPLFLYYSLVFSTNSVFGAWSAQNILKSPPPLNYIFAYGLLVVLAIVGGRVLFRLKSSSQLEGRALLLWPLVVPFLVYLPMISVQRRLAEAIIVPLAILVAAGLRVMGRSPRWRRARVLALVLMCSASVIFWLFTLVGTMQQTQPLYQPLAEVRALNWLNDHAPADSVVLAANDTGNVLPAFTNLRPYVGHGPETLRADEKRAVAADFFGGNLDEAARQALYDAYNIRYIIYGPLEQALMGNAATTPMWIDDALRVYEEDGYAIFERQ